MTASVEFDIQPHTTNVPAAASTQESWALRWLFTLLPVIVFTALCAYVAADIVSKNEGMLTYTLDDAYIHLSLAENVARGQYGVNLLEPSSPASSIIWPFLLVPFVRLPFADLVPLGLNFVCALLALIFVDRLVRLIAPRLSGLRRALLGIAFLFATNLVGLTFMGMEHCLQILCVVVVFYGLAEQSARGKSVWLIVGIILGPLVRYENLALSAPALLYLLLNRRAALAIGTGVVLAVALGLFSVFLTTLGLPLLPASVTAKSMFVNNTDKWFILNIFINTALSDYVPAKALAILDAIALVYALNIRKRRGIALVLVMIGVAHLLVGQYNWFNRYEMYVWAAHFCGFLILFSDFLNSDRLNDSRLSARPDAAPAKRPISRPVLNWMAQPRPRIASFFTFTFSGLVLLIVFSFPYIRDLRLLSLAAHDNYLQQYQLHRFVTEYYRAPVAVNDIGWMTYRNDRYVLDLWGLSSQEAQDYRNRMGGDFSWVPRLMDRERVRLAIVYNAWFGWQLPTTRIHVATYVVLYDTAAIGDREVMFFAADDATARDVRTQLSLWSVTLPDDVELHIMPGPRSPHHRFPAETRD